MKKVLILLGLLLASRIVLADQIIPSECALDKMLGNATYAFMGKCQSSEEVKSGDAAYTIYTFSIKDDYKKNINSETFKFRQAGVKGSSKLMPRYACGESTEQKIVLLYCGSSKTEQKEPGCIPVAMSCGVLDVKQNSEGKSIVTSRAVGSNILFKGVLQRQPQITKSLTSVQKGMIEDPSSNMEYDQFKSVVEKMLQNGK